jgi:uncharacterized protein (TIGR03435 family)
MNTIQFLAAQPWVERLGVTLLHFIWQGVLLAAVYVMLRRFIARATSPNSRYLLACAALVAMAIAPVLTFAILPSSTPASNVSSFSAPLSAAKPATHGSAEWIAVAFDHPTPSSYFPWMVAAWIAGALVCWLRLFSGWILAQRLRSQLVHPAPPEWLETLDRLRARIALLSPVRLLVSSLAQGPVAIGWLRPVILVPAAALSGLSAAQLEALLVHELAHIRRHDYLVNILQSAVEALLFYHPAVWWISHHIRAERELCCDDAAVSLTGDAIDYARALAQLALAPRMPVGVSAAATGGSLAHRIARLLGQSASHTTFTAPGVSAAAIVLVTAFAVLAQTAARPKFEAAVVKHSDQPSGMQRVRPTPGRLTADAGLRLLIQNAYGLQAYQIVGGPDWVTSDRYAVEATAGANVGRDQMFQMLQSLLEEQFQLKYHHETRELPVWALVPARSGIKLSAPKDGNCSQPSSNATSDWAGGRMAMPGTGPSTPPQCGAIRIALQPLGARMQGGGILMPELVRTLAMALGRPVLDRTGYTKPFDIQLDFLPDEITTAMPPPPPGSDVRERSNSPTITVAVQEQLGLRLESTKGPVEVMVIDHIERPSAN